MSKLNYISLIALLLLCMSTVSCSKEEKTPKEKDYASLSFTISSPQIDVSTKGLESPDNYPTGWSEWDKGVDGRLIYHITAFLVRKDNNKVVAFRDIFEKKATTTDCDINSQNGFVDTGGNIDPTLKLSDKARLTFNYNTPLHGNTERLERGKYILYIIANYSRVWLNVSHSPTKDKEYTGLDATLIRNIKTHITSKRTNFTEFDVSEIEDIISFKQQAGSDFVCPQVPQPLTLVKEIDLKSGENNISVELKRTYSRVRIELENRSNRFKLSLNDFKFSNNFAQNSAYIFDDINNPDKKYTAGSIGAPDVQSEDAIVKYADNTQIDCINVGSTPTNKTIIFDGYVLESKNNSSDNPYKYTIDVEYKDVTDYIGGYSLNETPITNATALSSDYSSASSSHLYLLKVPNCDNRFLISGDNAAEVCRSGITLSEIKTAFENNSPISKQYIWELEQSGSSYYIKNTGITSYYVSYKQTGTSYQDSDIVLTPDKQVCYDAYNRTYNSLSAVYFSVNSSNPAYRWILNVNNEAVPYKVRLNSTANHNGSLFYLYAVQKRSDTPRYAKDVPLTAIDPVTSESTPVTEIKRNDFVRVVVSASYNTTGSNINFEVLPWNTISGDIIYN